MVVSSRKTVSDAVVAILIAGGIFAVNVTIVWPLFSGGYTTFMGSIESAFLTDARFIAENFPYASWNSLWYMGFPFHLFYTPALPYLVAILHLLGDMSVSSAYRIFIGISYAAIPATFFLFVYYLTRRFCPAIIAALVFCLAPSFCYLIAGVRNDAPSFGLGPWHLVVLLKYGEGPHVSALAFTPLAALTLMHAMRHPSFRHVLLAALAISAVAMINWIALFGLTLILLLVLVSEMLLGRAWSKLKVTVVTTILTYGLCAFWFNLSFMRASLGFGGGGGLLNTLAGNLPALIIIGILAAPVLIFSSGKARLQPALVVGGWLLVFSIVVFGWEFARLALVPQPNRYMPELNMAAAMAVGLLVDWGLMRLWQKKTMWAKTVSVAGALAVVALIVLVSIPFLQAAYTVTSPTSDVTATSEYQVADWLAGHVKDGERVYATGSHAFWLNVFTGVPQIRGGVDFAGPNPWWAHVGYQINTGESGEISTLWAKALNIRYIVVSYPESADTYHDYVYPKKLEGLLTKVYDNRGMAIFEVPLVQPGFVRTIDLPSYSRLSPIKNAVDNEHLSQYVEFVEAAAPLGDYRWTNESHLEFDANLNSPQQAVLVRMNYHAGWRAYCNGRSVPLRQDIVGFALIEPQQQGSCR
ncbi:MAG: hypothetical protein ABIH46_01890, partial [Chloroflexota bacterium]